MVDTALEREFAACEQRQRLLDEKTAAERHATIDDSLRPHQVLQWLTKRLGVSAPVGLKFFRFPEHVAPHHNGFSWKHGVEVYVARNAPLGTWVHEILHKLRPELPEAEIRARALALTEEASQPVAPIRELELSTVEYVHDY